MAITVVTPPAALPVTVNEAKAYARVDHDDDDDVFEGLITAARDHIEQATDRTMIATTFMLTLDQFPANELMLPRSPLLSVDSVQYDDTGGDEQTLVEDDDYVVDNKSTPGWIVPIRPGWPATFDGINSVRVTFTAGYAPTVPPPGPPDVAGTVPSRAKMAVLSLVTHWYDERSPVPETGRITEIPYHLTRIINGLRVWR